MKGDFRKRQGPPPIDREALLEQKRAERNVRVTTRMNWYADQLEAGVKQTVNQRVAFCAQTLRDKIVVNIGKPVHKVKLGRRNIKTGRYQRARTVVDPSSRSKPGEFPRADTTRLLKDIFWKKEGKGNRAIVGTTLDYGLFLELFMDRSFILRTYEEIKPLLARILGTNYAVRFRRA